ncbi:hypothetical protein BS47DRAFT_1363246 [Hydnum rufescens UP504]|uniref:Uncharacterized protein n=1 Tax=Hydnum rufescens UP504 TaxID=1448309 RepID=A0A9P6AUR5_9AGAM|nr:hypothetical protein BS47DRAFT_1363246 [Hydnum rufescens UP504]
MSPGSMSTKNPDPGGGKSRQPKTTDGVRHNPTAPTMRECPTRFQIGNSNPNAAQEDVEMRPETPAIPSQPAAAQVRQPRRRAGAISPRWRQANEMELIFEVDPSMQKMITELHSKFVGTEDQPNEELRETQPGIHAKLITTNMKLSEQLQMPHTILENATVAPSPRIDTNNTPRKGNVSKLVQSANPIPIKPAAPSHKTLVERKPTNPASRNHPSRLIIETFPLLPVRSRQMGPEVVRNANQAIREAGASENVKIMVVMYSMTGNIIAIAGPNCSGADLKGYEVEIIKAIDIDFLPDRVESHIDAQRFKIKLDKDPTHNADGHRTSPEEIKEAIGWAFNEFKTMNLAAPLHGWGRRLT